MFRRGKGDTTGDNARQRFATHFYARQRGIDADAAGIPETRVLAHQAGIGRLDEDLYLDSALVLGQAVAFNPANLDLLVEHRAVTVERPKPLSLEGKVQARLGVRQRRRNLQGSKTLGALPLPWADGDVVA